MAHAHWLCFQHQSLRLETDTHLLSINIQQHDVISRMESRSTVCFLYDSHKNTEYYEIKTLLLEFRGCCPGVYSGLGSQLSVGTAKQEL